MLRGLYDWTMDKATHPHAVWWLAFFCFIEASFFPIPPHPLLGLMCLAAPNKAIRFALIATLSSVAGALFGYAIGFFLFDTVGQSVIAMLGLTESLPAARCTFDEYGAAAVTIAAATPVPFKLLTITAGFLEMSLVPFIAASLAGRALIFMTVGILFRFFGAPIKRVIDQYLGTMTSIFVVLVVGGFIALTQMGGSDEGAKDTCVSAAEGGATQIR
ncbi:YqaA family protein [Pontixanthobacter gangjinensis]|uniref:DedA family protein n=1 Tax=Pontixanthobacter gangjinensis TaxID=1028742 RepID=A0A6I4SI77_9SPHN|nr:YqaA family protein [Pontixanthobacter gangjinensis]MXO55501.1 DedA family protein [Pontixanthobacter gangjinensis]